MAVAILYGITLGSILYGHGKAADPADSHCTLGFHNYQTGRYQAICSGMLVSGVNSQEIDGAGSQDTQGKVILTTETCTQELGSKQYMQARFFNAQLVNINSVSPYQLGVGIALLETATGREPAVVASAGVAVRTRIWRAAQWTGENINDPQTVSSWQVLPFHQHYDQYIPVLNNETEHQTSSVIRGSPIYTVESNTIRLIGLYSHLMNMGNQAEGTSVRAYIDLRLTGRQEQEGNTEPAEEMDQPTNGGRKGWTKRLPSLRASFKRLGI